MFDNGLNRYSSVIVRPMSTKFPALKDKFLFKKEYMARYDVSKQVINPYVYNVYKEVTDKIFKH